MLHRTLGVVIALGLGAAHIDAANALVISFADRAAYSGTVGASTIDDYFGIDNLGIGTALPREVPEPSTLALFGLGVALVGIGVVRGRSKSRRRPPKP